MRRRDLLLAGAVVVAAWIAPQPADARPAHVIKIFKADRKLELWVGGVRVRSMSAGLGGQPVGDKVRQGDLRTPEGEYYVAWKNPKSDFHLFLGLSYPMPRHARAAHTAGRISAALRKKIELAVKRRAIPPQTTGLGGYVGIHGGGAGADWTLGCIAISDANVEWLYARTRRGDKIEVYP